MKYIKPIIAVALFAGVAFWMFTTLRANADDIEAQAEIRDEVIDAMPVRVATVGASTIDNSLLLEGTFEARKQLDLIAEAQGRITSLSIEEGQAVGAGQTIARIDDTNIQAQLTTARASLAKAQKDMERYERLSTAGAISQLQYEDTKLSYQNAQSNLTAVQQQLKYSSARAPMSGVVQELLLEQGSFVTPGAKIATIVDVARLRMVVRVDETDVVRIKRGQSVEISTDVYPAAKFRGKVSLISVQADAGRKYDVEIELPNPRQTPLKPGMYGTVSLDPEVGNKREGLFVPRRAIAGSLQQPQLIVVQDDNTVTYVNVTVGETRGEDVRIKDGVTPGTRVVTSGQINLSEGRKVSIVNPEGGDETAESDAPTATAALRL